MPDFTGKTEDEARAELSAWNVQVDKEQKIDAATAGTVIGQTPVAGADFAQKVTLIVAIEPPRVPDVTKKTFGSAQEILRDQGFEVEEKSEFSDTLADGFVTAQDPAPGTGNANKVTLTVIRRPVVQYLADMERVPGNSISLSTGAQKANGKTYSHGVKIDLSGSSGDPKSAEYDLSRQYRKLAGVLALDDKSGSDAQVRVEIFGDGRSLLDETVTFGNTVELKDVDVTNVLRLKITASLVAGKQAALVLGDVEAQGLQSEVESTGTSGAATTTTGATTTTTASR